MKIEKVDAHHHLWALDSPHYPVLAAPAAERFLGNTGGLKHDFGPAQFAALAAAQNVTRSVYVDSHFAPPRAETAFVDGLAGLNGFPHAILARADLAAPGLAADLAVHAASPRFRGLRMLVNWDADPKFCSAPHGTVLRDPAWRRGYALLGALGLVAEVMALPAQLADLADVARACPATPLVVGHAGLPARRSAAEHELWRAGIAGLAALPHVTVKISGLGMVDHHWTPASIAPLVAELIEVFGPQRCMFASNFPVDGLHASYDRVWDAFDTITTDYSDADRTALFSGTARRVFAI